MFKKDRDLLEALSKRMAVSHQGQIAHSAGANYILVRDGPRAPNPAIMTSKETADAAPTSVIIIHDDTKVPRFTGEEGGSDVHTFLCNVDVAITKRRLTTDEGKIKVLKDLVDPSDCVARSIIMSDYFKKTKSFSSLRKQIISVFTARSKLGPVSVLFKMAEDLRNGWEKIPVHSAVRHSSVIVSDAVLQFSSSEWETEHDAVTIDNLGLILGYLDFLLRVSDKIFEKLKEDEGLKPDSSILEHATPYIHVKDDKAPKPVPAFTAGRASGRSSERPRPNQRRRSSRSGSPDRRGRPYHSPSRSQSRGRYSTLFCNYCRKKGHTSSRCWRKDSSPSRYCSYHNSRSHSSQDCRALRAHKSLGEDKRTASPNLP